ncbi:hypothetical protein WA026_009663 [Henosepilachna vigintioctopunctata]|uniref:Uncharacterized protein n=1 Tax=Henosepilachna vigintioctopunctata TaxID=420089 RepID=A0AAW1TWC9_9CUCU
MKCMTSFVCFTALVVVIYAAPAPQFGGSSISANAQVSANENTILKRHVREASEADKDQELAESAPEPQDDLSNVDTESDSDRGKRFLPFGGDGHGGGSGNFLFDIIRLVAGSGATEEVDAGQASAGGVAEIDIAKGADGYTEGIPGPITRLFVIANRGIANLVQDLILRLAQTSERLVNFKARLVTALI